MFMRTVKMHVKLEELEHLRKAYEEKIIPAFENTKGCQSAVLMQSTRHPEECVSLTFWKTGEDAGEFEKSGRYDELIKVISRYFSEEYEMQIRLTEDLRLEYASSNEPEVRRYEVSSHHESAQRGKVYIRMVSLKFKEGKTQEFKKHYEEKVVPVLRSIKGCRTAFLAAPGDNVHELISVTEWEDERAIREYEYGGQFDAILESQKNFFPGLSEWAKKGTEGKVATSEDVAVDHHHVLVGKRFV